MPLRRFVTAAARTLCQTCWAAKADLDPRGAKRCRGGGGRKLRARTVIEKLLCGSVVGEGGGASCLSFFFVLCQWGANFVKLSVQNAKIVGVNKRRGVPAIAVLILPGASVFLTVRNQACAFSFCSPRVVQFLDSSVSLSAIRYKKNKYIYIYLVYSI